jgi:hypothetical protein
MRLVELARDHIPVGDRLPYVPGRNDGHRGLCHLPEHQPRRWVAPRALWPTVARFHPQPFHQRLC